MIVNGKEIELKMEATAQHIRKAIDLAEDMIEMADSAETACDDTCVFAVYGIVRDSAYRIRRAAENEVRSLVEQGKLTL